jgi:hypothetical protein
MGQPGALERLPDRSYQAADFRHDRSAIMTPRTRQRASVTVRVAAACLHAIATVVIVTALSYLFGHGMLDGSLQGSDSPLHVGYAVWLDQHLPQLPHWYPLQGGGASILHGYPVLTHLGVVLLHRLTGLSILQVFRLVSFAAFPLTALGVYAFSWAVLKRQTIGLLAAVFFLLAPVTWTWMYNWGFFAQQVAIVFLPLALIAFDRTLQHQLSREFSGRGRLWFTALLVLLAVSSLCHMLVGAAEVLGIAFLTVFSAVSAHPGDRRRTLRGGLKIILLLGIVAGILLAGYVVPFYAYSRVANREGLNTPPPEQLHKLPIPEFFGMKAIDPLEILTRMQFPFIVTGFAVIGILLALVLRRRQSPEGTRPRALALSLIVATVFTLSPGLVAIVLHLTPFLAQFVNFRSALLLTMMLMPVMAAYGVWTLAWSLLHPRLLIGLEPRSTGAERSLWTKLAPFAASSLALVIVGAGIVPAGAFAASREKTLSFGPAGVDLVDLWDTQVAGEEPPLLEQLAPESWPAPSLNDADPKISRSIELVSVLPAERPLRIDVSPYQGRIAMDLPTYGDVSQINAYTYTTSLVHAMWGYQQNVFYSRETPATESGNPRSLNNLSQWFGTQYVFLRPTDDPVETYQDAGWELTYEEGDLQVWHDPMAPPMATATTRPTILVVGRPDSDAYMTIFRQANNGMLPYADALLVEGQPRVDRYTLEQLRPFDAVFLYGYDYRDGTEAWETLAAYVNQGGNLFVDTGWEFWIPEWEFERSPEVLPIQRLTWTDYGPATQYDLNMPEIAGGIDVTKFKPLIWEGSPWMLSGAEANDVRDWGRVVLAANGRPLVVAGEYGAGKVVWSGMNLLGHARYGDTNHEELLFLGNLVRWLTGGRPSQELPAPVIRRDNPDAVNLAFTPVPGDVTWLYWREAFYPNWHAFLSDGTSEREVPIYRGGPGFMLMPIESAAPSATVQLRWVPSTAERIAMGLSGLGLLLLVALALDGLFLQGNGFTWLKIALIMRTPKPFLGEGSNREWAEQKRAELESGHFTSDTPPHLVPSQAISWWKGDQNQVQGEPDAAGGEAKDLATGNRAGSDGDGRRARPVVHSQQDGDSHQSQQAPAIEPPSDDIEQALLEAWLNGSGHNDDAWAEKLLSRRNPPA